MDDIHQSTLHESAGDYNYTSNSVRLAAGRRQGSCTENDSETSYTELMRLRCMVRSKEP
jgi:hypothetical protein